MHWCADESTAVISFFAVFVFYFNKVRYWIARKIMGKKCSHDECLQEAFRECDKHEFKN